MTKDLATIVTETVIDRETRIRQGKVTSIQVGPPRTLTVNITGTDYPGIRVMDQVNPVVGEGIWILDMGIGRWLAFGTNSSAQTRPQYVKVNGDAMTGTLNFPNTGTPFMTAYGDSSWMGFYSAGGGARRGYLQGNTAGLILNSEAGLLSLFGVGGVSMSPFIINGYTASVSAIGNRIVLTDSSGYINAVYINAPANVVSGFPPYMGGQSGDSYLRWYDRTGTFLATRCAGSANSNQWASCALSSDVGGGWAAISLHPGGVALVLGSGNGFGNNVYVRDSAFTAASAQLIAQGFAIESSLRWKKNINTWPLPGGGAASPKATDIVGQLRPVTFQHEDYVDQEIPTGRRLEAYRRLSEFNDHRNLAPYQLPQHECSVHDCNGTAEDPCIRHLQQHGTRFGLIAEEVVDVIPEAVHLDSDRKPEAIDYAMLTATLIAAVQELTTRIKDLEGDGNG